MDYIPLLVICAAVIVYFLLRSTKKKAPDPEVYVCTVCGEKDCLCHREEPH